MNRRTVTASLIFATPAFLSACSNPSGTVDPSQAIADARIVVDGIAGVYDQLVIDYPKAVSDAQKNAVAAYLATARSALTQLSATAAALANSTNLQAIEIAINNVLAVVGTVPMLPPEVRAGVMAAQVLLPLIENMIDRLNGAPMKIATAREGMSPDQARLTLRATARK